jgi:hypothetical protein
MMMSAMSKKRLFRATLGVALGVAILVGCAGTGARAAEEEDDDTPLDTKIFQNILQAIGLRRGEGANIEYRERSPLVVPPNRNLPPPDSNTAAAKNPTWPTDPEVKRRKEAKATRNTPEKPGDSVMESSRPLRPDELRGSGAPAGSASQADNNKTTPIRDPSAPLKPSELGYKGGLFSSIFNPAKDEEYTTFTGETPRTSLIEPPAGYRTPSPSQPYGVGKEKATSKPADRQLPVR